MGHARTISWSLVCTATALLAIEATVRVDDWSQHGAPLLGGYAALGEVLVHDSLGYHPRPGAQFRKFRINHLGYRGDEVPDTALQGRPIVLASGASETFGLYESKGREWPRQLQDALRAQCLEAPPVVLNGAFAGLSLPSVALDLRLRGKSAHPDVVVYYTTPMQYLESPQLPTAFTPGTVGAPAPPWYRLRAPARFRDAVKSATPEPVLAWLRGEASRRARASLGASQIVGFPDLRMAAFEADLRGLVGTIRSIGASPVLVSHRNRFRDTTSTGERRLLRAWERYYPLASAELILRFDAQAADVTARVARDSGVGYVDPAPQLKQAGVAAFADFSHFTDIGAAAMASAVAPAVQRQLGCGPTNTFPAKHVSTHLDADLRPTDPGNPTP